MWLSIPQSRTVLRLPGSRFSMEQKTSLPKQENACLSIACRSGSREAISDTVSPNPFAYCVLISVGIFQNPSQADQQLRVLEQLFFLHYCGQKLLLDIDHDERALAGIQSTARDFAVFAGDRTDIPENSHKRFSKYRFYPAEKHEPKLTSLAVCVDRRERSP